MKRIVRSEEEWRKLLTPAQYKVLREKATEPPFSGEYNNNNNFGDYECVGCGSRLFSSSAKFSSGCGWPAFDAPFDKNAINEKRDTSLGMERIEVLCSNCDGHLGHLFDDGPTESGMRYCINSAALQLKKD
jgi:peptide-methionine (R)-S-oxide reductase